MLKKLLKFKLYSFLKPSNVEIDKFITFSTGHVEEGDMFKLDTETGFSPFKREYGFIFYVDHDQEEYTHYSDSFKNLIKIAKENHCSFIHLDGDVPIHPNLPCFNW